MVEGKVDTVSENAKVEIVLRQKSAFAIQHLMAAARFSRWCGKIEIENEGKPLGAFFDEQLSCVSATVMLSVASMEANINEYFSDINKSFPEVSNEMKAVAFELIEKKNILEKYQYALSFKNKKNCALLNNHFRMLTP